MTRAALYLRISDDREGLELGIGRQEEDCRDLAEQAGYEVTGTYRDNDISASTKHARPRPDYERMIHDAKAGLFEVIVAYTSSRLTRRPREFEDQIDLARSHGVRYLFVRSPSFDLNSADGRQVARTLAAADIAEAERIAERVKRKSLERAQRGEPNGGPRAYGITLDGRSLVECEAAEVKAWYHHVLSGGTLYGIREGLNRRGVLSVGGKAWRAPVIRRILLNSRNAGFRELAGVEHPTPHPPIVDRTTWQAVTRILTDADRLTNPSGTARRWIGAGLYVCERCQRTVNSAYSRRRPPGRIYRCHGCFRSWKAEPLDAFVVDLVAARLSEPDARELLPRQRVGIDVNALVAEASAVRENMKEAARDHMLSRGATRAALGEGLRAGEVRLAEIESVLAEAGRADPLAAVLTAPDPGMAFRNLPDVGRRQAVVRSLATIVMGQPIRGRSRWCPTMFIGESRWVGDEKTMGEHWAE